MVTAFQDTKALSVTNAHQATKQVKIQLYQIQAVHQLQQWNTAARIQYCHFFIVLYMKGFMRNN
jgi:hypothetical protein